MSDRGEWKTCVWVQTTCGHETLMHAASSTFDFPEEPIWCKSCKKLRRIRDPFVIRRAEKGDSFERETFDAAVRGGK
jgi:hypothetical protein